MAEERIINGYRVRRNDDGTFTTLGPASAQPPVDPTFQYKGSQAAADLQGKTVTTQGNALENQITAATLPDVVRKTGAEATGAELANRTRGLPEGYQWAPDGNGAVPIPGWSRQGLSPEIRKGAIDAFNDARAIEGIVSDLRSQYQSGPGSTKGIAGLRDYLPTDQNKVFDDTGQRARGYVKRSLGFTGGEGNTVAESSALYDPYLPKAGDRDAQIESKINALEQLGRQARAKAANVLGGEPDERGNIIPAPVAQGNASGGNGPGSVWQQTFTTPGVSPGAAPAGSTTQGQPIDPRMQAELNDFIQRGGANLDPQTLRAYIDSLYGKYGAQPGAGLDEYAAQTTNALRNGGQINTNIPPQTVPLSGVEQIRNNAVNNPVGSAIVGLADAGSIGGVSLLDRLTGGNRVEDLGNASTGNAIGMGVGQVAGSIAGTGMLGALGRRTAGAAIPALLQGGSGGSLARGLGTDAIYSGIYGANQGDDPLVSAGLGAVGSAAGRGIGRGLGAAVGGVRGSPAVDYLRSRNIPLTTGQILGGTAKRFEDAMTSAPGIGDLVRARRLEGLRAFNREGFADAGAPISATVNDVGEQGVNSLRGQMSDAYNAATAGRTVPLDAQFNTDLGDVAQAARNLPSDYAAAFDTIGERRIDPLLQRGQMTGADYQQAQRGLRAARRGAQNVGSTGFDQEYRDVLTDTMRALEGNMRRGGGDDVVNGLNAADATRRNLGAIETAVRNAAGGSQSGENFLFTPSQLQRAGIQTEQRFPGARPFQQLADAGQEVLPSRIPDSGTAGRLAALAIPTALGGAGAGVGAYQDGASGAGTGALSGLALAGALALGGTRGGQRVLNAALADRPEAIRDLGDIISRRRGMFGRGATTVLLPIGQ